MGADGPGRRDGRHRDRTGRVFCDDSEQASHNGEIAHAVKAEALATRGCTDLGAVLAGDASGRSSDDEITIFDSTGLAIQDLAIALAALNGQPRWIPRPPPLATHSTGSAPSPRPGVVAGTEGDVLDPVRPRLDVWHRLRAEADRVPLGHVDDLVLHLDPPVAATTMYTYSRFAYLWPNGIREFGASANRLSPSVSPPTDLRAKRACISAALSQLRSLVLDVASEIGLCVAHRKIDCH